MPRSVRIASLYVKSKGVISSKSMSDADKLSSIYKLEKGVGGREKLLVYLESITTVTLAEVVGQKDMGRIFVELGSAQDALEYLDCVLNNLNGRELNGKEMQILECRAIAMILSIQAHATLGSVQSCVELSDKLNVYMNAAVVKNPSNKRIYSLYEYANDKVFSAFVLISQKYSDLIKEVRSSGKVLFAKFVDRDTCNEDLKDYHSKF